ncbi:MAG: helix-turn-helix domain-containing protein [Alphaproteobacteria bacterium]|nr:MAG: helix-turn-helix domain-containing protein [Alphaproteobacteria bacterium]
MGWVMMSERELNRIEVLVQIDDNRLTVAAGAHLLNLTARQIYRLLRAYRTQGASSLRHKARGRTPNNHIHRAKRDYVPELIRENYADFGTTLAAEMLAEHHGFKVTRGLVGKYVDTFAYPDGRLDVKWKGVALAYNVFDKDQRVTHAAITENKRLSAVLAHVKNIQDNEGPPRKKPAGKQKTRYKKTGRKPPGRVSFVDKHIAAKNSEVYA